MPKHIVPISIICCGLILVALFLLPVAKRGTSPEPQNVQPSEKSTVMTATVGAPAPDFQLTDIDGKSVTKVGFAGKPVLVWFTTSYCVPCQIAAKEIKRLDSDMGGSAFNVLMVFIDPNESQDDLRNWKAQYANDDWFIAFGNDQIIKEYQVRYLDSHRLLDQGGVVRYMANGGVTYEGYRDRIQALLQ